uniref:F-box domain-containing protein n=1 Tax=Panagrellus redivivus TaxID=6233 RepID=A0A7E4ZYA8_PANRE
MRCSKVSPKKPITPVMDLFALPTTVIEAIVSHLDTGSLHAFRNTSRQAAALTAFRGIQTHLLHIDPEARPGQIHSIQSKGKIVTTAALDAVLNTERVKVRHLLKIGSFHPADMELVADHIDSRFKSIVLEGYVNYKIFYSLIVPGKTVTMRLKDGIQLPASNSSRFWNYFPDQRISHVRRCFNSNHVFVKATYDEATDSHTLRVVPAPDWRPLYG